MGGRKEGRVEREMEEGVGRKGGEKKKRVERKRKGWREGGKGGENEGRRVKKESWRRREIKSGE